MDQIKVVTLIFSVLNRIQELIIYGENYCLQDTFWMSNMLSVVMSVGMSDTLYIYTFFQHIMPNVTASLQLKFRFSGFFYLFVFLQSLCTFELLQ